MFKYSTNIDNYLFTEKDGAGLLPSIVGSIKITTPEDLILAKILLKESPETKS